MSQSHLHGENNGLQQSAVCSLHFVLTDPTIILVLIMMMTMVMLIKMVNDDDDDDDDKGL